MLNADVARLINSDEIQSVVQPAKTASRRALHKKNPLVNLNALLKLNPYAQTAKRNAVLFAKAKAAAKAKGAEKKTGAAPAAKPAAAKPAAKGAAKPAAKAEKAAKPAKK
jgi:large subunit ribosomal protein L4e